MAINEAGRNIIKEFEGLRLKAYICPAGVLTIGYGHTNRVGTAPLVTPGMTITEAEAERILDRDISTFEPHVDRAIKRPMNENERAAFVSLCFNIGPGGKGKPGFTTSTAVKRFNAGDKAGAAEALTWWNKASGKVSNGLVRRREAERALFLTPVESVEEAPVSPSANVEENGLKPIVKSKTLAIGGLGGAVAVLSEVREVKEAAVAVVPGFEQYFPYVLAGVAALVIANRLYDRFRGVH
jgi:lysozyme